jgi:threonylcarbamoyladenosine tRNA methylthiotransferase CDKAL1
MAPPTKVFYRLTDEKSTADLWILNSCTVKNPAESHFQNEIESALKEGRKVIVSGTLANRECPFKV